MVARNVLRDQASKYTAYEFFYNRTTIEGVVEWDEGTLDVGSQMMVWMRPYPNVHQKPYVSVKYLDANDVVLQSASGFAQATAQAPP